MSPAGLTAMKRWPADSTFFVWQTAELPAEAPKTMDAKAREKVIAAWKRLSVSF